MKHACPICKKPRPSRSGTRDGGAYVVCEEHGSYRVWVDGKYRKANCPVLKYSCPICKVPTPSISGPRNGLTMIHCQEHGLMRVGVDGQVKKVKVRGPKPKITRERKPLTNRTYTKKILRREDKTEMEILEELVEWIDNSNGPVVLWREGRHIKVTKMSSKHVERLFKGNSVIGVYNPGVHWAHLKADIGAI